MINNFNYNGLVRIIINNKTFLIHNEGTEYLFKTIAKALVGYNISNEKPSILKIYDDTSPDNQNILTIDSLNLFASSYVQLEPDFGEDYANKWAARYLCYLPQYLINSDITFLEPIKFILANKSNNLAIIYITSEIASEIQNLAEGSQILIEWNLVVDNYSDQSNLNYSSISE